MFRRILKWALWCVAVLIFILIMGVAAVWVMPRAVSTDWAKQEIEARASRALQTPVTLDGLQWTWKEGVRIEGLRIRDDRTFGADPIISLNRLLLKLDPGQLMGRRLSLDLEAEGLKARIIRTSDGRTNLGSWLARLRPPEESPEAAHPSEVPDWRQWALALPGDLTARIRLQKGAVRVEDRQARRSLVIRDIALLVDVPSLVEKPVTVKLSSTQEMDGKPLPPVEVAVTLAGLVDATPAIQLKTVSINARCRLPGIDATVSGGLPERGIQAKMNLDFESLMAAAGPLLPSSLPSISGQVGLEATARLGEGNKIAYGMTVGGRRLEASRGPLQERRVGPLDFQFSQTGTAVPKKQELSIARGELRLQDKTRIGWEGRVRQVNASGMEADLSISDIALDIKEMAGLAAPFLPMDVTAGWHPEDPQGVSVKQMRLTGILPAGEACVTIKGLTVDLPGLELALAKSGLSVKGVRLNASEAEVRLKEQFPLSVAVSADMYIQDLRLSADPPIHVRGVKVAGVRITAKDLIRSPRALLSLGGTVELTESVTVEQMKAPRTASIPGLRHALRALIIMQDQRPLITLNAETVVESPSPQIDALSKQPIKGGIRLGARIENLAITALAPPMADVERVEGTVRLGDMLDAGIRGEAAALGETSLRFEGNVRLDLKSAAALIPASMRPKGTFTGIVETDWAVEGRRPTSGEQETLGDAKRPLAERLDALGFVSAARLTVGLTEVGLDLPVTEGTSLSVQGIRCAAPLTISLTRGLQSARIAGDLAIGRISRVPGAPPFQPPLSARLSFEVDEEDLSTLRISEALHLDPLKIDQDLQISVNRLERLLNMKGSPTLAAILRHLDVSAAAGLRTRLGPSSAQVTPAGLALTGPLNAGLGLELTAGKEILTRISLESGGLDVTAQHAHIQGLTSHIRLSKGYQLRFEGEGNDRKGTGSGLLSQKVLRPTRSAALSSGSGDALTRRLAADLGGPLSGPPTLSFESAVLKGGPIPLELLHGEIQLQWTNSLPSLDRFQVDAMGGSMLGDLRMSRQDDLFGLEMSGAFSGLDAATLIPEQPHRDRSSLKRSDPDTQISGRMSLDLPLSQDPVRVMNHLRAGIHLTHIGSRTLERLLYAMDPYEANEGIVKQRAILRKGTPEWVDLTIRHGNLALSGSVNALGARIALPKVERLNLTSLPIHRRLQRILSRLGSLEKGLKTLSADSILIGKDSSIRFVQNGR